MPRRSSRSIVLIAGCAVLCSLAVTVEADQEPTAHGSDVKAAFVFNFLKYVHWPESLDGPYRIAILGESSMTGPLTRIAATRSLDGRPLEVVTATRLVDLGEPHILVISAASTEQLDEILGQLRGRSVLTVGEGRGLAARGVALSFFEVDRTTRFEANPTVMTEAGLEVSSQLLKIAVLVGDGSP